MHLPATPTALLFAYAVLSNVALAVVPHEPAIIWYGPRLGVWTTTLVGTAGTVLAAVADHRLFAPLIGRLAQRRLESSPLSATRRGRAGVRTWPERLFRRFPVATIALSGLTPLPFFPFKALAFATGCPVGKYTAAVAARCLPRYALLAWLGATVRIPAWVMVALFLLLMVPSLRLVWWPAAAVGDLRRVDRPRRGGRPWHGRSVRAFHLERRMALGGERPAGGAVVRRQPGRNAGARAPRRAAALRLLPGPHRGCVLDGGDRRGDRPLALRESRGGEI